jgi:hypothetical protein
MSGILGQIAHRKESKIVRDTLRYPELTDALRARGFMSLLRFFGPGGG